MDLSHIAATDNAVRPVIEIVTTIRYYAKPIRADFGPGSIPIQRLWRPTASACPLREAYGSYFRRRIPRASAVGGSMPRELKFPLQAFAGVPLLLRPWVRVQP